MTKVEKVKKLMEKYGLKLSDLEDVEDEEEVKPTEPKNEEEVKVDKVEETKETEKPTETETENKVEETKEPVENGTTEESKAEDPVVNDPYKTQFEEFNKQLADLKALVEAQAAKTNKAYEMLDAQGKAPSEEEDNDFEFAKKLGYRDIQPNIADEDKSGEEFAKAFQTKKIR